MTTVRPSVDLSKVVSLADFEPLARRAMEPGAFDYVAGGAWDERSLGEGLAVEHGVAGIVVSNHGARQLDRAVATADVLEEIVAAVAGRAEVWVDGGIRRGLDVVTAVALGARGVLVGRPILWALATGGQAGVERALEILRTETLIALTLLGARTPQELNRAHVAG